MWNCQLHSNSFIFLTLLKLCEKLGWKPNGKTKTKWDILPLVLSASGQDPEVFSIPEELILRVPILHPRWG
jgi:nitric oxide synthase oxygenase domain/subunit